jgi:hypothetical protein
MMTVQYVVGDGVHIKLADKPSDLNVALNLLEMVREAFKTDALDGVIRAIHDSLKPPPAVYRVCSSCWTIIDPRLHSYATVDGKYVHDTCPK